MKKLLCVISITICLSFGAWADTITVSEFPYINNFDGAGDLPAAITRATEGGEVSYNASGWSGGCADIKPPTSDTAQGYSGIGWFAGFPEGTTDLYVRFLVKIGATLRSTWHTLGYNVQDKFIIATRSTGSSGDRVMLMLEGVGYSWYAFAACSPNNVCYYDDGESTNSGSADPVIKFPPEDAWVCVEVHFAVGGPTEVTTTTADGTATHWHAGGNATSGGYWSGLDCIGGFFNGYYDADAGNHIYLDSIYIDDSPIGIPDGFTSSTPAPPTLSNVTISNGSFR